MRKALVLAGILTAIGVSGCSKAQSSPKTASEETANVSVLNQPVVEKTACKAETGVAIEPTAWADANNEFGFAMLRNSEKSTVISPYSVERALGMVLDGACGETAKQMRTALSLPEADNLSAAGAMIENDMLTDADKIAINIDNRVWLAQNYTLTADYASSTASHYRAAPQILDFVGDPDGSRETINADVAKSTNDRIKDILPPGSVSPATKVVLTNAIYFKAPWTDAFDPKATDKQDFKGFAGTTQVDMMHHEKPHMVYNNDALIAFDMSFQDTNYAFMVILPKEVTPEALSAMESGLSAKSLREMRGKMEDVTVRLSMPKFRVEAGTRLKALMQRLGMDLAFTQDADFSAISGKSDIFIDDIYHKAFIEVAEEGAEAAAATAVVMKMRAMAPVERDLAITVDHPFVYAIIEKMSGTALFIGRVTDL